MKTWKIDPEWTRIKKSRYKAQMTTQEMADLLGIPFVTAQRMDSGKTSEDWKTPWLCEIIENKITITVPDDQKFCDLISDLRVASNLTKSQAAEKIGISVDVYRQIESGALKGKPIVQKVLYYCMKKLFDERENSIEKIPFRVQIKKWIPGIKAYYGIYKTDGSNMWRELTVAQLQRGQKWYKVDYSGDSPKLTEMKEKQGFLVFQESDNIFEPDIVLEMIDEEDPRITTNWDEKSAHFEGRKFYTAYDVWRHWEGRGIKYEAFDDEKLYIIEAGKFIGAEVNENVAECIYKKNEEFAKLIKEKGPDNVTSLDGKRILEWPLKEIKLKSTGHPDNYSDVDRG